MSLVPDIAPWQAGPVSSLGRITAGALAALAINTLLAWQVSPSALLPVAIMVGLVLVAIRVVRGFERSLPLAAAAFVLTGLTAAAVLVLAAPIGVGRSALVVAVVLAVFGVSAALAAWLEQRRLSEPPVIEIARPSTDGDGLARARRRPRVYR